MKKKKAAKFQYDGLGFPVMLLNVPVREIRGEVIPDIDYNLLQKNVLMILCRKPVPLTGDEVRFIRQYFRMTLLQFAKQLAVTHQAVMHWEKAGESFAKITPTTEVYIRLFILDKLNTGSRDFRDAFKQMNCTELSSAKTTNSRDLDALCIDSSQLEIAS